MDMTRGEETQNSETESKTLMCFTEIITSQPILRNKAPNPAQVQIHRGVDLYCCHEQGEETSQQEGENAVKAKVEGRRRGRGRRGEKEVNGRMRERQGWGFGL